jgi:hypothetical protein
MKAKILWHDRDEEQEQKYESMGIKPPEAEPVEGELYFDLQAVKVSYINSDGDIALHTMVGTWVVEYEEQLWKCLEDRFLHYD